MATTVKVTFSNKKMGAQFKQAQIRNADRIRKASEGAASDASREIKKRGDADIKGAGNFGKRWTDSFHSDVVRKNDVLTIKTFSTIFYFNVCEFGKVIHGKPLLWIPLSFARDALGVMARNFPGGLFRVDRKRGGAPLLLSIRDGQPKYFGKTKVRIPQKFHIRDICKDVASRMKTFYKRNFKHGR